MVNDEEQRDLECATEMLRGVRSGKSSAQVRKDLKDKGYTSKQISAAADKLIESSQ